jgi:hypothetical protein
LNNADLLRDRSFDDQLLVAGDGMSDVTPTGDGTMITRDSALYAGVDSPDGRRLRSSIQGSRSK